MLKAAIVVALCAVYCHAATSIPPYKSCKEDSECDVNQCCNNYHGPLIMSKRDLGSLLTGQLNPMSTEGKCENYQPEGSYCSGMDTMNGHCGCNIHLGLSCQFHPNPSLALLNPVNMTGPIVKRSMINPAYGTNKCTLLLVS